MNPDNSKKNPRNNLRKFLIASVVVVVGVLIAFSILKYSRGVIGLPFGGRVISAIPCTCDAGNFLLTLSPPSDNQYTYRIGTQKYLNYNLPTPGIWALGLYEPGSVCMIYVGKGCSSVGAPIGLITPVVGSSLAF